MTDEGSPPTAGLTVVRAFANPVHGAGAPLPSPWGRWRGAAPWRCTVTDEGSPPTAGLTAARTFENYLHGGGAALAPLVYKGSCHAQRI